MECILFIIVLLVAIFIVGPLFGLGIGVATWLGPKSECRD